MIRISEWVLYLFLFFLVSSGIFLLVANISVGNTKLDEQSQQDLANLNIYYDNVENPFSEEELNYSLSDYSNTDDFSQSNIETKGALTAVLDIFGNNSLSSFSAPFKFAINMLPIPSESITWTFPMIILLITVLIFIAFLAAWKGGLF